MIAARPISEVQAEPRSPTTSRRRHYQRSIQLYLTALVVLLGALGFASFVIFGARMFALGNRAEGLWALGGIVLFVVAKVTASLLTRRLDCQLCHGTVLRDRGCFKHRESKKLPGLSHRMTAVICIIFTLRFHCMYCGSGYRLLK
jgi:hypothetical protein